ncbi:unnamed protein product [Linum tenue]|uniref:Transmembrane protein n=1 Tax=Linum tenue TaxID=586396 RepID=A0AAV0IL98_9ROSI|nr:unnamed protein product [Linum tenue]
MAPHSATSILTFLFILTIFSSPSPTFITTARAQARPPHGLVYSGPVAFSPSAVQFFHPDNQLPHPEAAQVTTAAAAKSSSTTTIPSRSGGRSGLGAGEIAGVVFGAAFAVFIAMGAYYVVSKRRANLGKASNNSVQSHV